MLFFFVNTNYICDQNYIYPTPLVLTPLLDNCTLYVSLMALVTWHYNLFVGKDDTSVQVAEAINSTEVSCRLEQEDFVAIRLESGSETYRFFAQICILFCRALIII